MATNFNQLLARLGMDSSADGIDPNAAWDQAAWDNAPEHSPYYDESAEMADVYRQRMAQAAKDAEPSLFSKIGSGIKKFGSNVGDFVSENPNLVSAGAAIGSGLIGKAMSKSDYNKAMSTTQDAANLAGQYSNLGQSQVANIQDDPRLIQAQMNVLNKLQQYSDEGTTPEDEAYRRQQQNAVNKQFQARQAQIDDNMARRGVQSGSGLSLASAMTNNQNALQQAAEASDTDMIRKLQARRQATTDLANTASNVQSNQFNRDLQRGSAVDEFNKVNVANQMTANRSKANLMGNVANQYTQRGQSEANLATSAGNAVAAGIQANQQTKKNNTLADIGKKVLKNIF